MAPLSVVALKVKLEELLRLYSCRFISFSSCNKWHQVIFFCMPFDNLSLSLHMLVYLLLGSNTRDKWQLWQDFLVYMSSRMRFRQCLPGLLAQHKARRSQQPLLSSLLPLTPSWKDMNGKSKVEIFLCSVSKYLASNASLLRGKKKSYRR